MTFPIRHPAGVLLLALAIAGCSGGPKHAATLPPPPQPTATSEIDSILASLDAGDVPSARKRIATALKRDPMNPSVLVLRDSIDRDPKELLGPDSYGYTARAGDTMESLAQRFLGNRLKAYQLARYNGIAKPSTLAAGQTLRIPGEPPRIEVPKRLEPRPEPSATPLKAKPIAPKAAPKATPVANPVAARAARSAGLAALNQGNVNRAVGMLRRAASLDPGNPVIARDLARAQRIAATVKARK